VLDLQGKTSTRKAFTAGGPAFVVWVDRIKAGRYEDTNRMFVAPEPCDLRVTAQGPPEFWAEEAMKLLRPVFDPKKPNARAVAH
jgi:adenylylsulfate kinase